MDVDIDDIILDLSTDDDIVREVRGHASASTPTPSAPSVPMPEATTSMLAEMATTEYSFIQESVVRPQAPLLPEVIPQPPLIQADLIELRCARADLDRLGWQWRNKGRY